MPMKYGGSRTYVDSASQSKSAPGRRGQLLPVLVAVEDPRVLAGVQVAADGGATVSVTSSALGQMSVRNTGLPSCPVPSESVVRSMSRRPASAYATTSGGDARYAARTCGWMRPSKLRLPLSTAATVRSSASMRSATSSGSGPLLPMHVVQP
jgi:hypothetical protein